MLGPTFFRGGSGPFDLGQRCNGYGGRCNANRYIATRRAGRPPRLPAPPAVIDAGLPMCLNDDLPSRPQGRHPT
jgi:hypothetical protein